MILQILLFFFTLLYGLFHLIKASHPIQIVVSGVRVLFLYKLASDGKVFVAEGEYIYSRWQNLDVPLGVALQLAGFYEHAFYVA